MPESVFTDRIRKVISSNGGKIAIEADSVEYSRFWVAQVMNGIAFNLDDAGIATGARVGLLGRNLAMHFSALWSVFCSGRCTSMIHAFQPQAALAEDIHDNCWPVILGEKRDWGKQAIAAANAVGTVGFAFTEDPAEPLERVTSPSARQKYEAHEGDVMLELLSSGTTGKPKRISLTRKSVDDMIEQTIAQYEMAGPASESVSIMPWPLTSLGGSNAALPAAALGQRLVIQERFDAPAMLDLIRKHRPTMISLAPASFGMLLQLEPSKEDLASIKMIHTGSAPIDPAVQARLEDEYGIPVLLMYGATEFAGIICGWSEREFEFLGKKRGSVGRPRSGMQMRIVSQETGEPLPSGEYGLIEAIVPRIGPDWIRTTDIGRIDEDGFLFLQGRADDAIIRGGFKIIPEEVSEAIRQHPKVGDAAVVGLSDERLGMIAGAVIERTANRELPDEDELRAFLKERLPSYKVPDRFSFVDELPRTPTMKPQRQRLIALFDAD